MARKQVDPMQVALRDLLKWVRSQRIPFMVIGGIAVNILGKPRTTRDIDGLLSLPETLWKDFVTSGTRFHIKPRIKDWHNFALQSMVLLLEHSTTHTPIDLSIGGTVFEVQALAHHQLSTMNRLKVPLPRISDLIVFKAIARRPIDWADIDTLIEMNASIDQHHIQGWLSEFAEVLEDSTILTDYRKFIKKRRRLS